jgi:predicted transcriptional regulator
LITCEICSECPNYNVEWKSDITFYLNGVEVCTYESPGDMGGRHGILTPPNWSHLASQFGFLKNILVNGEGTYLDHYRASGVTVQKLNLQDGDYIRLKIGIKPDARHIGGVNLFGTKFGDFPQGLDLKLHYFD